MGNLKGLKNPRRKLSTQLQLMLLNNVQLQFRNFSMPTIGSEGWHHFTLLLKKPKKGFLGFIIELLKRLKTKILLTMMEKPHLTMQSIGVI